VEAIAPSYADGYDTWLSGGFALGWWSQRTGYHREGRELFHLFSEKSGKYNRRDVDEKWEHIMQSGKPSRPVTIGTLIHFAVSSGFSMTDRRQEGDEDYDD